MKLTPDIEVNFYGKDDANTGTGSGLSDVAAGLRLRYEIRRKFAPYIGINWTKMFAKTADLARLNGEDISDVQLVTIVHAIANTEVQATVKSDKRKIHSRGYETFLVRRVDGVWKVVHTHSSSRPVTNKTSNDH